jgi:hypothetical protein
MPRKLPVGESYEWPSEIDELMGAVSDRKLADALKVHVSTVAARRRRLGIQPLPKKRMPKVVTCAYCGKQFEHFGRVGYMRRTCPPPEPCQQLLAARQRAMNAPSLAKQLRAIPGWHFLDPFD